MPCIIMGQSFLHLLWFLIGRLVKIFTLFFIFFNARSTFFIFHWIFAFIFLLFLFLYFVLKIILAYQVCTILTQTWFVLVLDFLAYYWSALLLCLRWVSLGWLLIGNFDLAKQLLSKIKLLYLNCSLLGVVIRRQEIGVLENNLFISFTSNYLK